MLGHAWAHVRARPARLAAVLLAVALGTAFLAATAVFTATSAAGLRMVAAAPLTGADVVVDRDPEAAGADSEPDWADRLADRPGIAATAPVHARTVQLSTGDRRGTANVSTIADRPGLRWFDLDEGRWPEAPDEVVADPETVAGTGLAVGGDVRLVDAEGAETTATLVGVADLDFRPLTGVQYRLYAPEAAFSGDTPHSALAVVEPGTTPREAVEELDGALPPGFTAATAQERADEAADRFAGGSRQLETVLLAFALVALLASAMVIANTFTVLLAQRRRDTALLRLVGADRRQVRRMVALEAAISGAAGALIGTAAGTGLGYAGATAMGLAGGGLHVSPLALAGAFLVGLGTAVGSAWLPARRAAATAPVEALRAADMSGGVRFGAVHAVGAVLAVAGAAGAGVGTASGSPLVTVVGGFVAALGLLAALRYPIARSFGAVQAVLRRMGGTASLAGANLARNSGRAATAALALVLGLGLITALATAASTGRATIDADLRDRYPVDVGARVAEGSVARETVQAVEDIDALGTVEAVRTADVSIGALGETTLAGISPEMAEAAGAERLREEPSGGDGGEEAAPVMLVSDQQLAALDAEEGERMRLAVGIGGGEAEHAFTLYSSGLAEAAGTVAPVVREDVLEELEGRDTGEAGGAGDADRSMVWGVAGDDADRDAIADRMAAVAADDPDLLVGGALSERADITQALDVMVNLSVAMLLVTVVIAAVGVANTLGLSVLERTRESAMLRALGLTRSGLRGTLAVEAVVIGLVGAVLGTVIGVPFGIVGVGAIVGDQAPLVVAVPWSSLGLVVAAASVIGVVSSVAPARRAARIAPAEGLSDD
ncbi:FtsX-like permease family protein [Nocardiopsis suaedae]|uniref:ABC transporter permease n=1 Tax=Nocardiopsis suaedae TaxID=3018444 RepID=A0ABT4THM9_9ACTN|nr:ABC transporter permease [Nocardiopsis suaedae]MDA2803592.1 ABC transporter permease [Nocardiopsis suaedae]